MRKVSGVLCVLAVVALLVPSCALTRQVDRLIADAQAANPEATIVAKDETGDGTADVLVAQLPDGTEVEVPNSRPLLRDAQLQDSALADWMQALGLLIGVPGLVGVGRWWGRRKPMAAITDLVASVQSAKDVLTPAEREAFLAELARKQADATKEAVLEAKKQLLDELRKKHETDGSPSAS